MTLTEALFDWPVEKRRRRKNYEKLPGPKRLALWLQKLKAPEKITKRPLMYWMPKRIAIANGFGIEKPTQVWLCADGAFRLHTANGRQIDKQTGKLAKETPVDKHVTV